jgi:hypothetical protein
MLGTRTGCTPTPHLKGRERGTPLIPHVFHVGGTVALVPWASSRVLRSLCSPWGQTESLHFQAAGRAQALVAGNRSEGQRARDRQVQGRHFPGPSLAAQAWPPAISIPPGGRRVSFFSCRRELHDLVCSSVSERATTPSRSCWPGQYGKMAEK